MELPGRRSSAATLLLWYGGGLPGLRKGRAAAGDPVLRRRFVRGTVNLYKVYNKKHKK